MLQIWAQQKEKEMKHLQVGMLMKVNLKTIKEKEKDFKICKWRSL